MGSSPNNPNVISPYQYNSNIIDLQPNLNYSNGYKSESSIIENSQRKYITNSEFEQITMN
jgi:hypothetical protein